MMPVVFEGCFGWLHSATGKHGVVLCGSIGDEANVLHRSWRELAERLAAAGLPTLRFDYLGTGDSTGDSLKAGQVDAWLQSVRGAVRFLHKETAIEKLTLVGFRFGAALAIACAEQLGGVDSLVLLAPVTSGRAFRRELSILARLRQSGVAGDPSHPVEVHGITLTAGTVAELEKFEILQNKRRLAARALILTRDDIITDTHLADRLAELGVEVEEGKFTDYAGLRWQLKDAPFPAASFARVIEFIAPGALPAARQAGCAGEVNIPVPGICETALVFGPAPGLFGVLCEPPESRWAGRPALVFLSPGTTPHVGDDRMWVPMARQFAREGFTSLRFDLAGVGDSPSRADQMEQGGEFRQAAADVANALNWLETRGFSQAILIGNCWAAKLACTVALSEQRIVAQFLINPWHQFWSERTSGFHTPAHYLKLARNPSTWRALVSGAVAGPVVRRAAGRLARGVLAAARRRIVRTEAPHAAVARIGALRLQRLAARGVDTMLIYGEDDSLLDDLEECFGASREDLAEQLFVDIRVLPGVKHLFPHRSDRDNLAQIMANRLSARYPALCGQT